MRLKYLLLCAALLVAACGEDEPNDPNNVVDPNNENNTNNTNNANNRADMGDMGDMPDMPWPEDVVGQVTITYWQPDALYAFPELQTHAVFSPQLTEAALVNPVGWLNIAGVADVFIPDDYWPIPAMGESIDVDAGPMMIDGVELGDAGDFVAVGPEIVANRDEDVFEASTRSIYVSNLEHAREWAEEEDLSVDLPLEIEGGADIAAASVDAAITMASPFVITNHDPLQPYPLRYGESVIIEFDTTPEDDIVLMTVETFDAARVWQIPDDGSVDVSQLAADAQLPLGDEPTISFSRILQQDVPTQAGIVKVNTLRKVWLYGQRARPYTVEPKLWPVGATTPVRVTYVDGEFTNPTVDAGTNVTVENLRVSDTEGNVIEFDATVAAGAVTGPVQLAISGGSAISIPNAAWVAASLPSAGDCFSSVDEGLVADGAYFATDGGLDFGQFVTDFCPAGDPEGREQTIPISLSEGERLEVTLITDKAHGALYLVEDCDDLNDVRACSAGPAPGKPTKLEYWATSDETVLVVVDTYLPDDFPEATYIVNIKRETPTSFQFEPQIVTEGATQLIQFLAFGGDFTGTDPFSFGPGITIDQVDVFGNYAEVTITSDVGLADPTIDVTAEVASTPETVSDSLYISPYIAAPVSCMAADTAGALGPGSYEGLTLLGGTDAVTPVPCLSGNADGMEGIFRVDLGPSETLKAEVVMPGRDPVIYVIESCGGDVLSCADNTSTDRSEYVEFTASAAGSTVYLVVDGFDVTDSDVFYLDLDISL